MLKFKYTRVAGQRTQSLTPQKLPGMLRAMQKRAIWDGVTVFSDAKLSAPHVYVELGGQGQELWPRELFVPYAIAEQAALYLLATGRRDPSLKWVEISAFPRKEVRARKRTAEPSR